MAARTNPRPLPGDFMPRNPKAAALRVDHAGEYGATRIYAGQLAVLTRDACTDQLRHMAAQEAVHLAEFNRILPERRVRPTLLMPLWHVGGWLMGAATAALGPKAAMACTVAVEEVITAHYNHQLADGTIDAALEKTVTQFRDEEMEHHGIGLAHNAEQAPMYGLIRSTIRGICLGAIWISARI